MNHMIVVLQHLKLWIVLMIVVSGLMVPQDMHRVFDTAIAQLEASSTKIAHGYAEGQQATTAAPASITLEFLAEQPRLTSAQLAERERILPQVNLPPGPVLEQTPDVDEPPNDTATEPVRAGTQSNVPPDIPSTLTIIQTSPLAPTTGQSTINEPSVAQSGAYVFYTGNWYAARSTTGGAQWSYINPYTDMPDFCCDQDVIVDRGRDIFLWYRQGTYQPATGQNRFALGISSTGGASFCTYSFRPLDVNSSWTNQWFDYPHLALSNNFLYIVTNVFGPPPAPPAQPPFLQQVILRFPLDALQACTGFNYTYFPGFASGWGEPVQGATTTMYIGDHRGLTDSFRVFWQPENSGSIFWVDRDIPGWTFENGDASCPGPDGLNWCSRANSKIQAGWVRQPKYSGIGEVGFMWNARGGPNLPFPLPYVEAVTFRQDTLDVTGRPFLWDSNFTWHYPFASPNARGDLGVTVSGGSTTAYVGTLFAINDDYNETPPPWEVYYLRIGNSGATAWGDYVRNRPFLPTQLGWISSGHTQQGGSTGANTEPRYYVISRERDQSSVLRYLSTP
jgi:hypothetical protein